MADGRWRMADGRLMRKGGNYSASGETIKETRDSLREALEAFLEECDRMGSLTEILEEAGFVHTDVNWLPRQPIAAELVPVV